MEDISILSRSYTGARIDKNRALEIAIGLLNRIINEDQRNIRRVGVRLGKITKMKHWMIFLIIRNLLE